MTRAVILLLLLAVPVKAAPLCVTPDTPSVLSGEDRSQAAIDAVLDPLGLSLLYRANVPNVEEGLLAADLETKFDSDDPSAFVTAGEFGGSTHLLVKGGAPRGITWWLFELPADATEICGAEFFAQQGAISHVSLYGSVPEPATLGLLMPLALAYWLARKRG